MVIEAPEDPVLHAALEAALSEGGALTPAQLAAALTAAGDDLGRTPESVVVDALYESYGVPFVRLDDRWAHLPALLDGRVFTHRATAREVDHDLVDLSPDLTAIAGLEDVGGLRLPDGSELTVAYGYPSDEEPDFDEDPRTEFMAEEGSIVLPPGTLAELLGQPGDLLAVAVADGAVALTRVEVVAPHVDAAVSRLVAIVGTEAPLESETAVLSLCADLDDAFRSPQPPVGELIQETGLATNGDWLAAAGFDFVSYWDQARARLTAERHDITLDQAHAVSDLSTLHRYVLDLFETARQEQTPDDELDYLGLVSALGLLDPNTTSPGRSAALSAVDQLAAPAVAEALLIETENGDDPLGDLALGVMVELLEDTARRSARPALRWLRAMAYERLGRVSEAEEALLAAERLDPTWPLTLLDLARYASDRGDAVRGLALLARADPYEEPGLVELLQAFLPVPGPTVGRNEPCWCGSGRKFKQCHLHRPAAPPLAERAAWLYQKAARFLISGAWDPLLSLVGVQRAAYEEADAGYESAMKDPVVSDIVLFEGGAFAAFVQDRGFLLPDDELVLAEQWLQVQRSVFDVTAVRRGVGLTVRDLRTGEVTEIRERTASGSLRVGELICARVVPAGDTAQIFGGIEPVGLHDRDALLHLLDEFPDPEVLMGFLSRRYAPPTLVTSDGDPLVIAEAFLEVSDPATVAAALDRHFARAEGTDLPEWHDTETIPAGERVRATLSLDGRQLTVNAISDRRLDQVLGVLRELDPAAVLRKENRQPLPNTRVAGRLAAPTSSSASPFIRPEQTPPVVQAALADYVQTYEREWLDLPVPALSGLTPRQAADDPTRRDDLVRLLASFPDVDGPTEMRARRLRAALGLAPA